MTSKKFITTPIYYVNAKPHIGHLYTTIIADALTRFWRQNGYPAFFLTGTDEHGIKVQRAAESAQVDVRAHVDKNAQVFRDLFKRYGLIVDRFIRTTEPEHMAAVAQLWKTMEEHGYIYEGEYAGWYAAQDECFYTEKELVDGKAPTGATVEFVKESSYYFRLSAFQKPLSDFFRQNPSFVQPKERYNEALSFIEQGLQDLSISRSTVAWGIPVPGNPKHTVYVWIDALCNYITALGYPDINTDFFREFWAGSTHIIGKDILRFHAIFWPAFLMAAKLPLPQTIVAHGWWINKGAKMSKSVGNVIDPISLLEKFGADSIRYFLLREAPFSNDGDFSEELLIERTNSDLANTLGNLVLRVIKLRLQYASDLQEASIDDSLINVIHTQKAELFDNISSYQISQFCKKLWSFIARCNQYVDAHKPWAVAKEQDYPALSKILLTCLEALRHIAIYATPIIPDTAQRILDALGVPQAQRTWLCLKQDYAISIRNTITSPGVLFRKPSAPLAS